MDPISFIASNALLLSTWLGGATLGAQIIIVVVLVILIAPYLFFYKFAKKPSVDTPDSSDNKQSDKQNSQPPSTPHSKIYTVDDFCCPISLDFMSDPVIASDGCTYERAKIEDWFRQGTNNLSPMTQEEFENHNLIPNIILKTEIDKYLAVEKKNNKTNTKPLEKEESSSPKNR